MMDEMTIHHYLDLRERYMAQFDVFEFSDDEYILPINVISRFAAYCLRVNKAYRTLTDTEYHEALTGSG